MSIYSMHAWQQIEFTDLSTMTNADLSM